MGYKGDYVKTNYSRTYLGLLLIFIWLEFTQLARCLIGIQILTNVQHYVHRDHHPLDRHRCTYDKHYIKLDNGRLPKMIWQRTRTYNRYTQGRTSHYSMELYTYLSDDNPCFVYAPHRVFTLRGWVKRMLIINIFNSRYRDIFMLMCVCTYIVFLTVV